MVFTKNAHQHNVHNGGMVGNKNVLLVFIKLLSGQFRHFIPQSHSVEHAAAPVPDKTVGMAVMFFAVGQDVDRNPEKDGEDKSNQEQPGSPEVV